VKASRDPGRLQKLSLERIQFMNSKVARFGKVSKFQLIKDSRFELGEVSRML